MNEENSSSAERADCSRGEGMRAKPGINLRARDFGPVCIRRMDRTGLPV